MAQRKEILEPLLDILLSEFPEKEFPELYSTYLEWDDTIRIILDCVPDKKQNEITNKLMKLFWETYYKGARSNQHIPIMDISKHWKSEYEKSIVGAYKQIEDIRRNVLLEYYRASGKDEKLVQQLMKKAYEMSAVVH